MASRRRLVEKVTARVFCQLQGGGNPVTIFSSQSPLSVAAQEKLARTCQWESVMVGDRTMAFYMPTGEQVSFCAHAAMGGATQLARKTEEDVKFTSAMQEQDYTATVHEDDIVSLEMKATFEESTVPHPPTLHRIIRDAFGLKSSDLAQKPNLYPTFLNSSIARPKTLVYVNSTEALHKAKAPPVTSDHFKIACDAVETTGIYLYTKRPDEDNAWECRQFPRASGYPEDPATGIAAAALAVSLHQREIVLPAYKFYQGTAMGQASLILVENICVKDAQVSYRLLGRVEVDDREEIQVEE